MAARLSSQRPTLILIRYAGGPSQDGPPPLRFGLHRKLFSEPALSRPPLRALPESGVARPNQPATSRPSPRA